MPEITAQTLSPGLAGSLVEDPDESAFDPFVGEPERRRWTGLPRATWLRLEAAGRAPKRVQLSPRRVAWRLSDLKRWRADPAAYRADSQ